MECPPFETPSYRVRPMAITDLDQVMRIEGASFPMPWPRRAYEYEITQNRHSTMLVLESGADQGHPRGAFPHTRGKPASARAGQVLGYGGFWLLADEAHICTLAVDPDWRGRHLGELVLVSLLEHAIALGAHKATLEVRVSNLAAQRLYLKCGFEVLSRQSRYYADTNEDAYIMGTPAFDSLHFRQTLQRRRAELRRSVLSQGRAQSPP